MQKPILNGALALTIAGSVFLASCSSQPPSQTTTINVEVPESKTGSTNGDKIASQPTVEIDETVEGQATKAQAAKAQTSEPTDRDVEDPVPATKPKSAPVKAATTSSSRRSKSQLMDFYDRLDSKHFVAFGGVNRRSLLGRKGAIVDYKHNFIEIPGSANPDDGDLRKLQITLFPNGDEPWCAVSRIVWPRGDTAGALDFYYGEADDFDRHPRTAAAGFFPYKLAKTALGYESAYLPQRGLVIKFSTSPSRITGETFRYNRNFGVGEAAFVEDFD